MVTLPQSELRCPATGQALELTDGWMVSQDGTRRYPLVGSIPILVDKDLSVFSPEDVVAAALTPAEPDRWRRLARAIKPSPIPRGTQRQRFERFVDEVVRSQSARRPRVLVIGGGTLGAGAAPVSESSDIDLIETDVFVSPRTSIVCDGHHLPFVDGSFDGVVVQAVLEHVLDPVRVVAEIHRVLAPSGIVYAETPFLYPVHEGPYDFSRWTETGHRRLFRMFRELDCGVVAGPATSLLLSIRFFARSIPRRRSAAAAADWIAACLFFWLKHLDRFVVDHAGATDGASGVYFLGARSAEAVPDADVLASYRGTIGVPVRLA